MIIPRILTQKIKKYLQPNKVVVIYGPRRVGKTTLIQQFLKDIKEDYLLLSGEDRKVRTWLGSQSIDVLTQNIGNKRLVVIDEAQKIDQIGLNLKLMVDSIDGIKIIAIGSSSFDLAKQIGEPLVGRKWQLFLYPIAQMELSKTESIYDSKENLPTRLVYGSYPEVITQSTLSLKQQLLNSLVDGYLYKDLLELEGIKKSQKILDLLKLIAFQIGYEVSLNELANSLDLNQRTVEKYLDLLEKVFVVKRVYGFSRNLRKEVTKNSRFYFWDNGIRNAIINNFNDINTRNDIGQLWENYLFTERVKKQSYKNTLTNNYFWRTYEKKEIDLVEDRGGQLYGFEFKWGKKKSKTPKDWIDNYTNATFETINQENYLKFIT